MLPPETSLHDVETRSQVDTREDIAQVIGDVAAVRRVALAELP